MSKNNRNLSRRKFLATTGAASATFLAGCGSNEPRTEIEDYMVDSLPAPTQGEDDAPNTVQVFSDYMCPHCKDWRADVFPELKEKYIDTGQVKFVHRDFPIPVKNPASWNAAYGGRHVQDTVGNDAFFAYFDEVLSRQANVQSVEAISGVAESHGSNREETQDAIQREVYFPVVKTDKDATDEYGINSTPGVVVNGSSVGGSLSEIEDALSN